MTLGTVGISYYARGYKLNFNKGPILTVTGLISATSRPKSASVYLDNRLITATDDTLNLPPGEYEVKIGKDGYLPWTKKIKVKPEVVFQTDAQLFRSVPDLRPLTFTGALNPTLSPDGNKIIYSVASASASKDNGLYLLELTDNPLLINKNIPKQISPNFPNLDWSKATFEFSPNSQQAIASFANSNSHFLLNLDNPITQASLYDITPRLELIRQEWQQQLNLILQSRISKLPSPLQTLVSSTSAQNLSFSPTEDKILYLAKTNGDLPSQITPPPAQSTQPQQRRIQQDFYYVYDLKDDTNFLIGPAKNLSQISWLPNSNTLLFIQDGQIKVIEYDSTNIQTIFGGDFDPQVVLPAPDGNKIITLTSPYTGAPRNLYSITIR
jgi:hypothetical protein